MNPYLLHALVALLLALPALAATQAADEPPVEEHPVQAVQGESAEPADHAGYDAHAGQGGPAAHDDHDAHDAHDAHADPSAADALETAGLPENRWASDAPLREGMRRVRAATEALSHAAHGHLDPAQVKAVAVELEAAVQDMIARCRLAPEPDAALHPLLARVLRASAALADGQFDPAVLADLEAVLARYPALFEDVGWSDDHSASA